MTIGKKALIIGGAGFIGTQLARHLLDEGFESVVCADLRAPKDRLSGVSYVQCDVRTPLTVQIDGTFDVCYNLAAVHTTPGHPDHEYYDTNVFGAMHVVDLCEQRGIETLLFTSSLAVYGPDEDTKTEASEPAPVSAYGKSKLQAEFIHRQWMQKDPARKLVIVRPAVIFGAGEGGNFARLAKALKRGVFLYPGRRDTRKASGYVKELVRSFQFALARPERPYLYNFCFPELYDIQHLCDAFNRVAVVQPPRGTVPLALMHAAAIPFEVANAMGLKNGICRERIDKLVKSTAMLPARLTEDGYRFSFDLESALRDWLAEDSELAVKLRPDGIGEELQQAE